MAFAGINLTNQKRQRNVMTPYDDDPKLVEQVCLEMRIYQKLRMYLRECYEHEDSGDPDLLILSHAVVAVLDRMSRHSPNLAIASDANGGIVLQSSRGKLVLPCDDGSPPRISLDWLAQITSGTTPD